MYIAIAMYIAMFWDIGLFWDWKILCIKGPSDSQTVVPVPVKFTG